MTMRQRSGDVDGPGGLKGFALEHTPQRLNLRSRPIGDIGQCALADLVAFAKGFPKQNGRRRVSVWHGLHVHGHLYTILERASQHISQYYMATQWKGTNRQSSYRR